jgi:hypothetical protein
VADDFVQAPAVIGRQRSLEERLVRRHGRASANGLNFALHGSKIAIFPKPRNAGWSNVDPNTGRL